MFYKVVFFNISLLKKIKFFTFRKFLFSTNIIYILKKIKKRFIFFFFFKKKICNFIFNFKKKKKNLKKKSKYGKVKEIKIKINIDNRDFKLKVKQTNKFLLEGYNIKVTIVFRGREIIFKEKGIELILKLQNEIKGVFFKFSDIELEGKYLFSYFIPKNINDKSQNKKIVNKKIYI